MKFRFIIYSILFFISTQVFAAGPVMHAYLAQKWLEVQEKYNQKEEGSFVRGNLFVDINYLGIIPRNKTHIDGLVLQDIFDEKIPFSKGIKLHSFIDEKREEFAVKYGIYNQIKKVPGQRYRAHFLKLLEDEILYAKKDWSGVKDALKDVRDDGINGRVKKEIVMVWYRMLSGFFQMPPSKYLAKQITNGHKELFSIPIELVKEWSEILPKLAKEKKFKIYVDGLVEHFDGIWIKADCNVKQ